MRKMKTRTLKIIILTIVTMFNLFIFSNSSMANNQNPEIKNITKVARQTGVINPNDYKPDNTKEAQNSEELAKMGNTIIGFLQILGSILSVAVLAVLGVKYMVGSVEERAEYKKNMMPYIIGAVMVFAITNLLKIIVDIVGSMF